MIDEYVAATIEWCNERRAEQGMEPITDLPKGQKRNGESCPCGSAANVFVSYATWWPQTDEIHEIPSVVRSLPDLVSTFIDRFDDGHYPQYELEDAEDLTYLTH